MLALDQIVLTSLCIDIASYIMSTRAIAQKLLKINREIKDTRINIEDPTVNPNYSRLKGQNPIGCLVIPNELFSLWSQRRPLEEQLGREVSRYTELVNESFKFGRGTTVRSLETRLETISYRFHAKPKGVTGGRFRAKLTLKWTYCMLLQNEVDSIGENCSTSTFSNSSTAVVQPSRRRAGSPLITTFSSSNLQLPSTSSNARSGTNLLHAMPEPITTGSYTCRIPQNLLSGPQPSNGDSIIRSYASYV